MITPHKTQTLYESITADEADAYAMLGAEGIEAIVLVVPVRFLAPHRLRYWHSYHARFVPNHKRDRTYGFEFAYRIQI
jgi:hypothetical protein